MEVDALSELSAVLSAQQQEPRKSCHRGGPPETPLSTIPSAFHPPLWSDPSREVRLNQPLGDDQREGPAVEAGLEILDLDSNNMAGPLSAAALTPALESLLLRHQHKGAVAGGRCLRHLNLNHNRLGSTATESHRLLGVIGAMTGLTRLDFRDTNLWDDPGRLESNDGEGHDYSGIELPSTLSSGVMLASATLPQGLMPSALLLSRLTLLQHLDISRNGPVDMSVLAPCLSRMTALRHLTLAQMSWTLGSGGVITFGLLGASLK